LYLRPLPQGHCAFLVTVFCPLQIAETFVDIALFGEKKIDLLHRFRPFPDEAHNLITKAPAKNSLRLKRKMAGSDDDFLASLIAA
jgi:hypothetical protein